MAPEYTDDQEEGEYTCSKTSSSFSSFFQIHPTNSLFFQSKSLHASSCLLLIITRVEILQIKGVFHVFFCFYFGFFFSCVSTEVHDGWQFRPPPRGVTSSEEYTLCKRYERRSPPHLCTGAIVSQPVCQFSFSLIINKQTPQICIHWWRRGDVNANVSLLKKKKKKSSEFFICMN